MQKCKHCSAIFKPRRASQVFCSTSCRNKSWVINNRPNPAELLKEIEKYKASAETAEQRIRSLEDKIVKLERKLNDSPQ